MLKARRRLLTTLITLTVIALGLVVTGIEAYWIVIPPTVLLAGYAVLLRQFAHIDAERARRAARIRLAEARARAGQEPASAATQAVGGPGLGSDVPAAPGDAEVIDISGRIVDQVYDQYSDAANRAVGD
jgi:predicted acyltransferase